jgi:aminoglycoside phosphotransferase (APT) family kinase protein
MNHRLHPDEPDTDAALVRRLLAAQLPHWAALPLVPVDSAGTDHALYRLGSELVVRLPRIHWARAQVAKEQRWLPVLAAQLPLAIPAPVAQGHPGEGYPWHWSVYRWLPGETVTLPRLADPLASARQLAQFLRALQRIDASAGPVAGEHNSHRGMPLVERDAVIREALRQLHGQIDVARATAAWNVALQLPPWPGLPRWVHGDLQPGNLLVRTAPATGAGPLCAVIDFGCLGVGDPAVDLIVAWSFFPPAARTAFRAELAPDDATWARGRGWALYTGLVALPYYQQRNPGLAQQARHTLQVILEQEGEGG